MIKKRSINVSALFFGFFVFLGFYISISAVDLQVTSEQHSRVKLLICTVGKKNNKIERIAKRMQQDLLFTRQFEVVTDHIPSLNHQRDIKKFFTQDFPLAVFLSANGRKHIDWRLYDVEQAMMIAGKSYNKRGRVLDEWAHHISDAVWPVLTGLPGPFSTKIAYCKEVRMPGKKPLKHVYIADFDGGNEKLLVSTSTVNVAPRWNRDPNEPLLFYSEHTNENIRLVAVDMKGKRKIVSNFDGINMLPAFSPDGKKVVFCASRGVGKCQLYYFEKGLFKKLTHNQGNNICPSFSEDGETLFFCSDFETKGPQIYSYDFKTEKLEKITHGGYCVSPSYCAQGQKLAYAKMIHGTMQIFLHDLRSKKDQQITFDTGNKEECSWSPCGNYLLFAVEKGRESRLAMLNLISNDQQFVTPKGAVCCYPAWSWPYYSFPLS